MEPLQIWRFGVSGGPSSSTSQDGKKDNGHVTMTVSSDSFNIAFIEE